MKIYKTETLLVEFDKPKAEDEAKKILEKRYNVEVVGIKTC